MFVFIESFTLENALKFHFLRKVQKVKLFKSFSLPFSFQTRGDTKWKQQPWINSFLYIYIYIHLSCIYLFYVVRPVCISISLSLFSFFYLVLFYSHFSISVRCFFFFFIYNIYMYIYSTPIFYFSFLLCVSKKNVMKNFVPTKFI